MKTALSKLTALLLCVLLLSALLPAARAGDDESAAEEDEAEGAAVLPVGGVRGLGALGGGELPELLAVAEDEVHVAVEGHELAHQLTAVLDGDPHAVVDVLKHLGALRHRHCCFFEVRSGSTLEERKKKKGEN